MFARHFATRKPSDNRQKEEYYKTKDKLNNLGIIYLI